MRADATRFESFAQEYHYWRTLEFDPAAADEFLGPVLDGGTLALDAGCGSGVLSFRLAPRCRAVVGLDVSWAMLGLARRERTQLAVSNVHFVVGDLEALPFRAGAFGFVLASFALHRTPLEITLPALRDVIAPGGHLAMVDVVSRTPRVDGMRMWTALHWLRQTLGYLRRHGVRTGWRIMRFFLSRVWLDNVSCYHKPTPDEMAGACRRFLPRCAIVSRGSVMTVRWEAATE